MSVPVDLKQIIECSTVFQVDSDVRNHLVAPPTQHLGAVRSVQLVFTISRLQVLDDRAATSSGNRKILLLSCLGLSARLLFLSSFWACHLPPRLSCRTLYAKISTLKTFLHFYIFLPLTLETPTFSFPIFSSRSSFTGIGWHRALLVSLSRTVRTPLWSERDEKINIPSRMYDGNGNHLGGSFHPKKTNRFSRSYR